VRLRPVTPSPARLGRYRRIERRRGLPPVMKLFFAISVVLLGAAVLWLVSGQVGPALSSAVRGFGGLVSKVGIAAGSPNPTAAPSVAGAPEVVAPDQADTNNDTINVKVTVPVTVAGLSGYQLRLYVTLPDTAPRVVAQVPVGATAIQVIQGVKLAQGRNDLQASIVGPGGESKLSSVATWVLDTSKPKVTVTSPKDGTRVSTAAVNVKGTTQPGSSVRLQDAANGATATVTAGADGLWQASITVAEGANVITVTATDPAGNSNTATLNLRKGTGKLTATLNGSAYRFQASKLPKPVSFTVKVIGADGRPIGGALALFTISVPGLQAIVSGQIPTDANGAASFSTTIPAGATPGGGLATVLVTAGGAGTVTDRQVLTITK
jgi:hypothetical protein